MLAATASCAAGQGVVTLNGCGGASAVPGMPCGTWYLNQALSAPTAVNFGYFDPLGQPCSSASRNGQHYPGCPARSSQAPDVVNALPGFPVYSMTQNANGVKYTLYSWTVGTPGSYEAIIGFAPGTAATYSNYAGVQMNLYASPIANTAQAPYVTFAHAWAKNPSNPNAVAYTLTWAALTPPPNSPPPPPLPPAPPPDAPDPVIVEDINENTWAVWTSNVLLTMLGVFLVLSTIVCCMRNNRVEQEENLIEKGEAVDSDDEDQKKGENKISTAARAIQRKASSKRTYVPPPPPSSFIVPIVVQ